MKKLIFLLAVLASSGSIGQLRELRFSQLTIENGLPENYAVCSLQDHIGYIWIGTQNGLVRYDGYQVIVYKLETAEKKDRNLCFISSLFEDSKGNVWIGTFMDGLFLYDRLTEKFIQFSHKSPETKIFKNEQILSIVEDKSGSIWTLNFSGNGEYHLDRVDRTSGTLTSFHAHAKDNNYIPSTAFNYLVSDSKGKIWLGTENGMYLYEPGLKKFNGYFIGENIGVIYEAPSLPGTLWLSRQNMNGACLAAFNTRDSNTVDYRHSVSPPKKDLSDTVLTIFEDHAKRLWIGTTEGLSLLDQQSKTFTSYRPGDENPEVDANNCIDIKEDLNGGLWILSGKGLLYLSSTKAKLQRFTVEYDESGALPHNTLYNLLIDRNGLLWVGTRGFGMLRLNEQRSRFEYIHNSEKLRGYPGGSAIDIALLKNGNLLVSTSKGLYQCDSSLTKFEYIPLMKAKESLLQTRNVTVDKEGIAWVGSTGHGLFRYDPKTKNIRQYLNDPKDSTSLASNYVRLIYEDRKGRLWIGTWGGGLCLLNKKTGMFKQFPFIVNEGNSPAHGALDDDDVMTIYEDREGILWVGTNKGGVNRFNEKQNSFTSYYDLEKGLLSISATKEDRAGRLWVGTNLWGLFLFDREKNSFKAFREKDGLVHDNVQSITEDNSGQLWIASGRGYTIIDPKKFHMRHLTTANGLPNNGLTAAHVIMPDGTWLTGSSNGIIRFAPEKLVGNLVPPQVVLQTVTYTTERNGKPIDSIISVNPQTQIELAYNENRIIFQYVGIHYSNPSLNNYKYQLVGYDKGWIAAGTQRSVTYTNLSPGTYAFHVKASSSDGVWTEDDATITVIINPPWWKTWWAFALYVIVVTALVWAFVSYRSRTLRRKNIILEERVQHRTVQLTESLEHLKSTQTQLIQSEKMASLGAITAGIAHEIQNPLNFVNNFSEVSAELITEMQDEINKGNNQEVINIAGDVRQNLEKIIHHGKRADAIVKGMLQHSRQTTGQKEPTDIHAMIDEYLRLAYNGMRAKDQSFIAAMQKNFDDTIPEINIIPQDISRVLLNLFNNALYSVNEKRKKAGEDFEPMVSVSTKRLINKIEIKVKDNGNGIPQKIVGNIFQPFFTTKPTGNGPGLGLSLSYDIIKAHGGEIKVESIEGEYAEFIIELPAS